MRILILGKCYSAKSFYDFFKKNKENIVFTTIKEEENYIELNSIKDIVDFCEGNALNLVLIIDEEYINLGLQELITSLNISAFSPSSEAISIVTTKSYAKKFLYRNKIQTPKFSILEKPQLAYDYIKENNFPLTIKPDNHNKQELPYFCETYRGAKKIIDNLFATGNKKIIIEDYIEGKNITVWTVSDGYSAKILGKSVKYLNDVAIFNPSFLDKSFDNNLDEILYNDFINPTLCALSSQEEEYIGILGFDFISTFDNQLFLVGFNSFFDDISVDFFTKGFNNLNWAEVFDSVIIGDVFLKYNFKSEDCQMLTIRDKNEIKFLKANTKSTLKLYLDELEINQNELIEAKKIWKF